MSKGNVSTTTKVFNALVKKPMTAAQANSRFYLGTNQFHSIISNLRNQGVDVDVLWRVEPRGGKTFVGRSSFRQPLAGPTTDQPALVAAQRQALRRVAAEIAKEIATYPKP